MSKNLCITGVSGFIGMHVAEEAIRRGYRVSGVDTKPFQNSGVDFVEADIRDRHLMAQVMKDRDYVVHLAAVTSNVEFAKHFSDCYDVNAAGFLNVIDAAAHSGCQRFVYASSAAVYLDTFSESAVIDFGKQRNHYAKTKIMNEMVAQSYDDVSTMKSTGLRYFNVYGKGENKKGDYASIITILSTAKTNGEPLIVYGDGTQARDLIHVTDVARITLDLLERGSCPVYNVGTGVATAYQTIAEMIDRRSIRHVPNPLSSYQYYTRAETQQLREVVGEYKFMELEKAIREG
jgi:nucleoside-diphosphate-sugar epimerase